MFCMSLMMSDDCVDGVKIVLPKYVAWC